MCIRHDVSAAVRTSAPVPGTSSTLSRPIATEVSAFLTANVPPNPQHARTAAGHQGEAFDCGEQSCRPIADAEQPRRVAGRVERDRVREAGADIGHAEDVDEELAQLEDARRDRRDTLRKAAAEASSATTR